MGMDAAEQYLSRQLISKQRNIPTELNNTIFLNDLKLKWNSNLNAYISEGKLGIGYLDKYRINALVKGKLEVKKSRAGDELTIYFEINGQWYFFKYFNNVMQVLSSNETFNKMIRSDMDSKREKNRLKLEEGTLKRSNYRYILSKIDVKDEFLNRVNTN